MSQHLNFFLFKGNGFLNPGQGFQVWQEQIAVLVLTMREERGRKKRREASSTFVQKKAGTGHVQIF